jgi:hypothetical protein
MVGYHYLLVCMYVKVYYACNYSGISIVLLYVELVYYFCVVNNLQIYLYFAKNKEIISIVISRSLKVYFSKTVTKYNDQYIDILNIHVMISLLKELMQCVILYSMFNK